MSERDDVASQTQAAGGADDPGVQAVAAQALDLIADGARVGLGSGRAAVAFITKLGDHASGPAALQRVSRDILSLSGVSAVIWLEGINDLGPHGQASLTELEQAIRSGVRALRSGSPAIRVIGATLTPARGSPEFGAREEDRKALNAFIRASGVFDAVIDFDGATAGPRAGALKPAYAVPTNGVSTEDGLHPNRAGYLAMAGAIDLDALVREIATEPSS